MVPQIRKKPRTVADPPKSSLGSIGECLDMKKASGKLGSKPSKIDSQSFVDDLNESQLLRERLRIIVAELKATVEVLEQNLAEARSSVRPPRKAKRSSASRPSQSIMGDELENREDSYDEEIVPSKPVRTRKGARS